MSKSFQHPLLRRAAARAGSLRAGGRCAALLAGSVSAVAFNGESTLKCTRLTNKNPALGKTATQPSLGQACALDTMTFWNCTDCRTDRLADFYVLASTGARCVRIQLPGTHYLGLAEVQVSGR